MYLDNFNYSLLGTNATNRIVFVHGLMSFSANWRKIASKLETEFQCLIYDQRGHGRSFKPASGYAPENFAEDLNIITDELGWDQFHLVGHSMGARNAMVFANLHPEKVKTLTIEDMGPDSDPQVYSYYEQMLNAVPTPFKNRQEVKDFFEKDYAKVFSPKESASVLNLFLQANIEEKENGSYDWKFSKQAISEIARLGNSRDYWTEAKSFEMPVLLIHGESSHVLKQSTYQKMLDVNPHITGVQILGSGHWVHYEKYEEFTTTLRQFLNLHNA